MGKKLILDDDVNIEYLEDIQNNVNHDDINDLISKMMENIYDEIHNTSIKIQEQNNK